MKALWPEARLMFKRNIERAIQKKSMILEHALTSDRGGCHKNPLSMQWGKMNAGHLQECKEFLPSLRNKILASFNLTKNISAAQIVEENVKKKENINAVYKKMCISTTDGQDVDDFFSKLSKVPVPLLFIDRGEVNTLPPWNISDLNITAVDIMERKKIEDEVKAKVRRDLIQSVKDKMLLELRSKKLYIGRSNNGSQNKIELELPSGCLNENVIEQPMFNVSVVTLQGKSFKEQISLLTQTKMVISMHGNGLTHLLWISPERTGEELLVEIFPHGAFTLDYQLQATISGIHHFAFDAQNGLISGSTDTSEGTPCYDKIKPYDISQNLNSVVEYLNIPLLSQQLGQAAISLLKTGTFPPKDWRAIPCSSFFDKERPQQDLEEELEDAEVDTAEKEVEENGAEEEEEGVEIEIEGEEN